MGAIRTKSIEALIKERYTYPEWAVILEFSGVVGSRGYNRRADAVAFNCWESRRFHRLAFEVKRSRHDFMVEIDNPEKRRWLEENFHQTYFVVAPGIVQIDEVPEGWGLLVVTKDGTKITRRKAARHREVPPFPEWLSISAIRSLASQIDQQIQKTYAFESQVVTPEELEVVIYERVRITRKHLEDEWNQVRRMRRVLEERGRLLEAPLRILAQAAGTAGYDISMELGFDKVLEEWISHIRRKAIQGLLGEIQRTRNALDCLLQMADTYDLFVEPVRRYHSDDLVRKAQNKTPVSS